jgi:hypothetical protein
MPLMRDVALGAAGSDSASLLMEAPLTEGLTKCIAQKLFFRCEHNVAVETKLSSIRRDSRQHLNYFQIQPPSYCY